MGMVGSGGRWRDERGGKRKGSGALLESHLNVFDEDEAQLNSKNSLSSISAAAVNHCGAPAVSQSADLTATPPRVIRDVTTKNKVGDLDLMLAPDYPEGIYRLSIPRNVFVFHVIAAQTAKADRT